MGPTKTERTLVARCLMSAGILIGSEDEIWTHMSAARALQTMRLCVAAIQKLVSSKHGVQAAWIKAVVIQDIGKDPIPFALDEVAEFMVEDRMAREHWNTTVRDDHYPHTCPRCRISAAFIGFNLIDCKARCHG